MPRLLGSALGAVLCAASAASAQPASKAGWAPWDRTLATALRDRLIARGIPPLTPWLGGPIPSDLGPEVRVSILAREGEAVVRELRALGISAASMRSRGRWIEAEVPEALLPAVGALSEVLHVAPLRPPRTRAGRASTGGDVVHRSDEARALFGVTGAGVEVGVLSDGVAGIGASALRGDAPAGSDLSCGVASGVDCSCTSSVFGSRFGREGTAMIEIVHDVAPGAGISFAAFDSQIGFADAIDCLRDAGTEVIVDDVGFPGGQSPFENDVVADAADAAAAAGALYVSAAGNDHGSVVFHPYADRDPSTDTPGLFDPADLHDFGTGLLGLRVRCGPRGLFAVLHWDEAEGLAAEDFDLYVLDPFSGLVASSTDVQDGAGIAREVVEIGCSNGRLLEIQVDRTSAAGGPRLLHLQVFDGGIESWEVVGTDGYEIYGHPAAAGAIAVGAVELTSPGAVRFYSSRGPAPVRFPLPEDRLKPDVVAVDGVRTAVRGFRRFFGTSAAAPHVAGLAALLRSAGLSASQARAVLTGEAIDLGVAGPDPVFGAGRVDARGALALPCGDGALDPGEECDDGNLLSCDGCSATCRAEAAPQPLLDGIFRLRSSGSGGLYRVGLDAELPQAPPSADSQPGRLALLAPQGELLALGVEPGAAWTPLLEGLRYREPRPVARLRLRPFDDGRVGVNLLALGVPLPAPDPRDLGLDGAALDVSLLLGGLCHRATPICVDVREGVVCRF
jgi:cysteine-rich repeat protein